MNFKHNTHSHSEKHHSHHHHHHTPQQIDSLNAAFIFGIVLNLIFVVVEFVAGFLSDSVGLLSDAGHNLSDVASLVLAMLAYRLAKVKSNQHFTYGYKKGTVLVSLANAILLLLALVIILKESVERILSPQIVESDVIIWVAATGVVINGFSAWLFVKDKDSDLNVRGAYLHLAADALVSIGVVASGIVIRFTGWNIIDPIVGLIVAVVIIISTWRLLSESLRLSLDGVPKNIDVADIEALMLGVEGVEEIHHIHVWAISTTHSALTAHVVVANLEQMEQIKLTLKERLEQRSISHATLEFELPNVDCSACCV